MSRPPASTQPEAEADLIDVLSSLRPEFQSWDRKAERCRRKWELKEGKLRKELSHAQSSCEKERIKAELQEIERQANDEYDLYLSEQPKLTSAAQWLGKEAFRMAQGFSEHEIVEAVLRDFQVGELTGEAREKLEQVSTFLRHVNESRPWRRQPWARRSPLIQPVESADEHRASRKPGESRTMPVTSTEETGTKTHGIQGRARFTWPTDSPPPGSNFKHGAVQGLIRQFEKWLGMSDEALRANNGKGAFYIRQVVRNRKYEIWFSDSGRYALVNKAAIEAAEKPAEPVSPPSQKLRSETV